jgi:hypothetical protein
MKYYIFLIIIVVAFSFPIFAQNSGFPNNSEYEIKHLSTPVNTEYDELAPFYIKKHNLLVFTSNRKYNGKGENQNLFMTKNTDSLWSDVTPLNSYINSKYPEGSFTWSEKNDIIYFSRKINRNTDIFECEGFISDSSVYIFTEPKACSILNSSYWDSEPCITSDGQRIFFASDRPGGFGGSDIWVSDWDGEKWNAPYNLGEKINSKYNEFSPFFFDDEKELYFSSNRKGGVGNLDFYSSQLNDSGWTYPQNMGEPINSIENELFFFRLGDTAFFSSSRYNKNYDIFLITPKIKIIEKPAEIFIYSHYKVLNKSTEKPVHGYIPMIEDLVDSKIITSSIDAFYPEKFHFESLPNHLHKIRITSKGFLEYNEYYRPDIETQTERKAYLIPLENTYILNVSFQKNESMLNPSSYAVLDSAYRMLYKYPEIVAEIAGHTDSIGNNSLNNWVSQLRADVVRKYLISKGISPDRITAKGYGSKEPVKSNKTEEGRKANRRVEMRTRIKD